MMEFPYTIQKRTMVKSGSFCLEWEVSTWKNYLRQIGIAEDQKA